MTKHVRTVRRVVQRRPNLRLRRGAILVIALITLLIVSLITGSVIRSLIVAHRQARLSADGLQALWLAEAAMEKARGELSRDNNYRGETWRAVVAQSDNLQGDDDPSNHEEANRVGVAEIRVERSANASTATITVEAHYPDHAWRRASAQRTLEVRTSRSPSSTTALRNASASEPSL